MCATLDRSGGMLMAESVAGRLAGALGRDAAHRLVRDRVRVARERGVPLGEVLDGVSTAELAEVLLQVAVYAGAPRANRAFAVAREALGDGR
jgi:adenylosuccinate lyase